MESEAKPTQSDLLGMAKEKVRSGPVPNWVVPCSFSHEFKGENHASVTFLLLDSQLNAETNELHVHNAIRLETMEAVQHHSQWRVDFDPQTQAVTLHSLKVLRAGKETDQLRLEKAHYLQREEGLEGFVLHGWFTLLLVLEDVRSGDILEFSYTLHSKLRLLPDSRSHFFSLPAFVAVGRYHFVVRFQTPRAIKWKSSAESLKPAESLSGSGSLWEWTGENYLGSKPEPNTPSWYLASPWIQVSDIPDWGSIIAALAEAWHADTCGGEMVESAVNEISASHSELSAQIEAAIRLVQDDCRYFSSNVELGGLIPSPAEVVIRRRFGDCKDLSWLLVEVLKRLGVSARPVLVHTLLQKTVGELLPSLSLFNHVIVEFEFDGAKYWVDPTLKGQGGGPLKRFVGDFVLGLPVDLQCSDLLQQPKVLNRSELVEVTENLLLDTSGRSSLLAIIEQCEGTQADILRHQLSQIGLEEIARQRQQSYASKFGDASRVGTLKYRDDRENNQLVIAEAFEIRLPLVPHSEYEICRLQTSVDWVVRILALPDKAPRAAPFFLPHPCKMRYTVDVESPAIWNASIEDPRSQLKSDYLQFNRRDRAGRGFMTSTIELETRAGHVPASEVEAHRQLLEKIWCSGNRELRVRGGVPRTRKRPGFGELPSTRSAPQPAAATASVHVCPVLPPTSETPQPQKRPKHRSRREYRQENFPFWLKVALAIVFSLIGLLILLIALARLSR